MLAALGQQQLAVSIDHRFALQTPAHFGDGPQCVHDVNVRIAGCIMERPVADEAAAGEFIHDKRTREFDVLGAGQFDGKSDVHFA